MIVIPLALLAELAAHEHQLLAGMAEHEAVIGAQIGKALPVVAGHAAEDRAFAVHDLVMRQRQDEVFRKRVVQAEQDVAVMVLAVDRILADIFQRVVHPAHVPFVAEAEPAILDRPRHLRPRGRFFRRRGGLRIAREHFGVEAAQEVDGFEIFPPAMLVRNPFARRAGCSRDRASRRPHRRAGRRCRSGPARTARSTPGNSPLRCGRNCRSACPSRDGGPAADWRARRARCRRNGRGRADRRENARAPSRATRAMPSRWQASTSAAKSSGVPNRLVGAYRPVG